MEDLSSCYFCGTAIEAPVREYPVVPEEVGGSGGPTVTLCPTCRRKHRAVVEAVVATLEGRDPDLTEAVPTRESAAPAGTGAAATPAETTDPGRHGTADGSGTADGPDAPGDAGTTDAGGPRPTGRDGSGATGVAESTADPDPDGSAGEPDADPERDADPRPGTSTGEAADESAADAGEGSTGGPDPASATGRTDDGTGDDPTGGDADAAGGDDGTGGGDDPIGDDATAGDDGIDDDGTAGDDATGGDGIPGDDGPEPIFSSSTTAGEVDDEEDSERLFTSSRPVGGGAGEVDPTDSVGEAALADDEDENESPDVDLSTPPHSKVVRQLQNREFPVDREEIVTVATGAYGLSEAEATEALDGLVAQGILEEEDGRLYRADDRRPGGRR